MGNCCDFAQRCETHGHRQALARLLRPPRARDRLLPTPDSSPQPHCRAGIRMAGSQRKQAHFAPLRIFRPILFGGRTSPTAARGVPRLSRIAHAGILSPLATCNAARSSTCTRVAGIAAPPAPNVYAASPATPAIALSTVSPVRGCRSGRRPHVHASAQRIASPVHCGRRTQRSNSANAGSFLPRAFRMCGLCLR